MKRLGSSDSLGALISMCPAAEAHSPRSNQIYGREYQSMLEGLDEEGCVEESGNMMMPEKKRRLSVDQVKALERNFEVENKLEPERKVKLAQDLGLQPRQVAVWFQNRRARWKTKQLERDYGLLKANFDALKLNFESLQHDNHALLKEIKELKSKLNQETISESNLCIKEEALVSESDNNNNKKEDTEPITSIASLSRGSDEAKLFKGKKLFAEIKDGPSDSDSSMILNDENSPNASNSSCGTLGVTLQNHCHRSNSTSINGFSFTECRSDGLGSTHNINNINHVYNPQFVKMEEYNFFSGEEACNLFSDEQAPSLHWYCPDQWLGG